MSVMVNAGERQERQRKKYMKDIREQEEGQRWLTRSKLSNERDEKSLSFTKEDNTEK